MKAMLSCPQPEHGARLKAKNAEIKKMSMCIFRLHQEYLEFQENYIEHRNTKHSHFMYIHRSAVGFDVYIHATSPLEHKSYYGSGKNSF